MIDRINAEELADKSPAGKKVKRVSEKSAVSNENQKDDDNRYGNPSAIKRGTGANVENDGSETENDSWNPDDQNIFQNINSLQPSLYNSEDNPYADKVLSEYAYDTNRDKLDEALENAVLKSELYGEPAINQYRYYGDNRKRRRRNASRKKRRTVTDLDLSPEEILTLLALYESKQRPHYQNYEDVRDDDEADEWYNSPVYPHSGRINQETGPSYYYDQSQYSGKQDWNSIPEVKSKRFMVAKRRMDPTREIRYLNGPTKNDFYTLSQLLSNQREPNVPVYQRYIL